MAQTRGIKLIHIPNRKPSNAQVPGNSLRGFPDLLLVGRRHLAFAELKSQDGGIAVLTLIRGSGVMPCLP
jgi:hypothetical protein